MFQRWFRQPAGDPLAVSMSGIKLGDRLLIVGGSDVALAAALAGKVGLTGRACLLVASEEERGRAAAAVEQEGVLVESFAAPLSSLPFDGDAFDVAVLRNAFAASDAPAGVVGEVQRVVRPGGRVVIIDDVRRGQGQRPPGAESPEEVARLLSAAGFRAARVLAEREGLLFVEGVKPNLQA